MKQLQQPPLWRAGGKRSPWTPPLRQCLFFSFRLALKINARGGRETEELIIVPQLSIQLSWIEILKTVFTSVILRYLSRDPHRLKIDKIKCHKLTFTCRGSYVLRSHWIKRESLLCFLHFRYRLWKHCRRYNEIAWEGGVLDTNASVVFRRAKRERRLVENEERVPAVCSAWHLSIRVGKTANSNRLSLDLFLIVAIVGVRTRFALFHAPTQPSALSL